MCHFQIAPGLVVFSISEFKAVPRSRCNHLCDPRAAISRQRSVTLYFFFLLSFLPPPFFSFSLRFRFISFLPLYLSLRLFFQLSLLLIEICHLLDVPFLFFFSKSRPSYFFLSFLSFLFQNLVRFGHSTHCLGVYIFTYAVDRDPVSINR